MRNHPHAAYEVKKACLPYKFGVDVEASNQNSLHSLMALRSFPNRVTTADSREATPAA